jgi:DNA-binding NarL/FixJ family response regulator
MLVDDHNLVRRGLAALLHMDGRYKVIAEADNGEEALQLLESVMVDVAILDLSMPRMNGLETIQRISRRFPRVRALVLSMYSDQQFVARAMQDGARGYILKDSLDNELFLALDKILRGEQYVSSAIDMASVRAHALDPTELTDREREVLQLIVDGHTTQETAEILNISPHTATRHRANLMQKLDAHSQVELVRAASQRGLIIMPKVSL